MCGKILHTHTRNKIKKEKTKTIKVTPTKLLEWLGLSTSDVFPLCSFYHFLLRLSLDELANKWSILYEMKKKTCSQMRAYKNIAIWCHRFHSNNTFFSPEIHIPSLWPHSGDFGSQSNCSSEVDICVNLPITSWSYVLLFTILDSKIVFNHGPKQ